jgi:ribose transport system substrate-binding protein
MRKGSRFVAGVGLLAATVVLGACGGSSTPSESPSGGSTSAATAKLAGKRLCISSPITVDLLTQSYNDMKTAAKQSGNGLSIVITDANGNTSTQLSQATQMANQNCAAIAAVPLDGTGWQTVVAAATAKKIPFFNHSSETITGAAQFVAINHFTAGEAVGKIAGTWLKTKHPEAAAGVIEDPGSTGLLQRSKGFEKGLKESYPGVKIYTAGDTGADTPSGAKAGANLLQAHRDVRVLFGYNDPTGLGAFQAATEKGYKSPDDFFVASDDGTEEVIQKIQSGTIYQATGSFFFRYSFPALERDIERVLLGQKVPPTAIITTNVVTKDTAADALAQLADPFSSANSKSWCTAIGYSNTAMKTGDPLPDTDQDGCRSAVIPK